MISSAVEPVDEIAELESIFDVEHRDGAMIIPLDNIRTGRRYQTPFLAIMLPPGYPASAVPEMELFGLEQVLMTFQLAQLRETIDATKRRFRGQKCVLDLVELVLLWITDPLRGVGAASAEPALGEARRCQSQSPLSMPTRWRSVKTTELRFAKVVGEGVHGKVYKCYVRRELDALGAAPVRPYAAKRFLSNFTHTGQDLIRELATLARLSGHPYVAALHGVAHDLCGIQLLLSYHNRTLHDIHFRRDLHRIKRVSYQLMALAKFMREQKVIHRDWKPANLLWDDRTETVKLADFGQSRFEAPYMWHKHIFTLDYRPPEICLGAGNYTNATDMWSIALIIYFMAVRGPLFDTEDEHEDPDLLRMIFRELGVPSERDWPGMRALPRYARYRGIIAQCAAKPPKGDLRRTLLKNEYATSPAWASLVDLLSKMLVLDPDQRLLPGDALKHPFFETVLRDLIGRKEVAGDDRADLLPNDPQIVEMRKAVTYVHPPPRDRTPLNPDITDTDAHVRSTIVLTVLSHFQTHRPLAPATCLQAMHLYDTFVDQAGFASDLYVNTLLLTACCMLTYKFDEDHFFDEDAASEEEEEEESTDEYLSRDVESDTMIDESSEESDEETSKGSRSTPRMDRSERGSEADDDDDEEDTEDEEDEEDEEEEEDDEDPYARGVERVLKAIKATKDELKKMEALVLQTVGLKALSEVTLPHLLRDATAAGALGKHSTAMYYYLAMVAESSPFVPLRYSCTEIHAAVVRLCTCDNTLPELTKLLAAERAAEEIVVACKKSPFSAVLPKKESQRVTKMIAAADAAELLKPTPQPNATVPLPTPPATPPPAVAAAHVDPTDAAEGVADDLDGARSEALTSVLASDVSDHTASPAERAAGAAPPVPQRSTSAADMSQLTITLSEIARADAAITVVSPDEPAPLTVDGMPRDVLEKVDARLLAMRMEADTRVPPTNANAGDAAGAQLPADAPARDAVEASLAAINITGGVDALAPLAVVGKLHEQHAAGAEENARHVDPTAGLLLVGDNDDGATPLPPPPQRVPSDPALDALHTGVAQLAIGGEAGAPVAPDAGGDPRA